MFLLDSGAFTFFSNSKGIDWDNYIERYADFINQQNVKYFFELDIDALVGYEKVKEMRRALEKKTARQCIPVWHKSRGTAEYKRLCDEYPYIAIGGIVSREIKTTEYHVFPAMITEAHKRGAQVHGLGFTGIPNLEKYKFDSVDSTRWSCVRFGRVEYFDGTTIRKIDKRKDGKRLIAQKRADILDYTFLEWVKFQKYAEVHL